MSLRAIKTPAAEEKGTLLGKAGLEGLDLVLDRQRSATDQVHAALRQAIIAVRLAPGSPISENSICRRFDVSRTPVRAALQRLTEEGLVYVYPQIGSFVAPIRLAGLQDNHFIRRSLEVALLREVAPRWTPDMSLRMRQSIAQQKQVIAKGDGDGFYHADEEFHHHLASFAGREGVWQAILAAKVQLSRFQRSWQTKERLPDVIREHTAIIDALDQHDLAGAETALLTHLDMIFVIFARLPEAQRQSLFE
ncbi:GntR family transcriptional regulator [Acidisoma cellulosilytica]|uniref:GntR family transcriptional regulator n=1 Tax=Acidisoma cellulosilyticum TaxID=2802395 RepID=A0A964E4C1_9PROT|nr:GntR family transcriptional regulator [Acidisoma cellulosilyticum]MCB8881311.1 GntR family transcriptional regulator [Acidisoma cellulosilyticum]